MTLISGDKILLAAECSYVILVQRFVSVNNVLVSTSAEFLLCFDVCQSLSCLGCLYLFVFVCLFHADVETFKRQLLQIIKNFP